MVRPHIGIINTYDDPKYAEYEQERLLVQDSFWYDMITDSERSQINQDTVYASALWYLRPWIWTVECRANNGRLIYLMNLVKVADGKGSIIGDPPVFLKIMRNPSLWWFVAIPEEDKSNEFAKAIECGRCEHDGQDGV